VLHAVTDSGTLTATLGWTNPTGVATTTLRYADHLITKGTWASSSLVSRLPGSASSLMAVVPYGGKTVYIALKSQNAGGDWSGLSNNAFWPNWDVLLPVIINDR
jgi:hypothetical protein